jgi:polyferredoxin
MKTIFGSTLAITFFIALIEIIKVGIQNFVPALDFLHPILNGFVFLVALLALFFIVISTHREYCKKSQSFFCH